MSSTLSDTTGHRARGCSSKSPSKARERGWTKATSEHRILANQALSTASRAVAAL